MHGPTSSYAALFDAVLFDMDGVVVDTEQSVTEFWLQVERAEGVSLGAEDMEEHVYGRPAAHTLSALFPMVPENRYREIYASLEENNRSLRYTAIAGAGALLASLKRHGIPLALVTGAQHWKAAEVIRQLGLTNIFDVTISAEHISAGKPDPECYLLAAERLGARIDRCMVFEDAMSGIASAVAAGAPCVALASERRRQQALSAGAISVVADLREVQFCGSTGDLHVGPRLVFPFVCKVKHAAAARSGH